MVVGILKEHAGENRVVCLPEIVAKLKALKADVLVEKGAGNHSYVSDEEYEAAGAAIASRDEVLQKSSILLQINRPEIEEVKRLREGLVWVSIVQPLFNKDLAIAFAESGISCFALDMIPRTTRAQAMDILSSQATAGGYKAVLTAALHLPKFFPMFMTAAGTITPAKVLILGAGVAGLQAISTARRLGAVVEAFDTRSAVKEEVQSLGAKFIEVEGAVDSAAAGGYAVEQTEEYKQKQRQKIHESAVKSDVIITTAQIPGRTAPILITKETVAAMKKGSVIVDMAASTGGNCELTKNGEILEVNGVKIIGDSNLPGTIPQDASKMFGKNVLNFLQLIITKEGEINLNFDDDLVVGCCVSHQKEIIHPKVKEIINQVEA
jgi:NAD(P) transhydrogenase subunit alpha